MLTSTVCAAVSAGGLGIALLTAYRKRFLAATRIAAFALIPIGLVMTGIIDWVTDLVFKPTVWAGFGVLALSALLFLVSRAAERRGSGGHDLPPAGRPDTLTPGAPAIGAPAGRPEGRSKTKGRKGTGGEFDDIEAILKKHGI
ncbi:hypothetical protein J7W19_05210 [Streptomyces mobaraensis NBRC 13819 = DSM 40847]|uniref:Uncharacterized protein n=2 Tax=Streptomyces mobaraensis TaxID=35621 RepID=A0A5N5VXP0_STRMB|nr:hypothetical protein [Streptomyces mobaraensis]EMF00807.1 hypothetical protein H340_09365 [Streptomyces mobaraensis NBRC 13819 = DSM 40847]KAB7833631.1 hypothetical protein FRZ00_33150 [Streptomyces mobaraensis]QTT72910.1 hypothetical protein J7W19_05210 [Streptomyces mobaraensis NBRC 13819 = DSM 40847]